MKQQNWNLFVSAFVQRISETLVAKGRDYNDGEDDRLQNFRSIGADAGVSDMQAALVLASKHWDAIKRHCRGHHCTTEDVRHRLLDLACYTILIAALEEDRVNAGTTAKEGADRGAVGGRAMHDQG